MTSDEARRHDIYTGFVEVFGAERAGALMDYLASLAERDIATKADITNLEAKIDALGARIDRIVFAILAALVVLVARSFF